MNRRVAPRCCRAWSRTATRPESVPVTEAASPPEVDDAASVCRPHGQQYDAACTCSVVSYRAPSPQPRVMFRPGRTPGRMRGSRQRTRRVQLPMAECARLDELACPTRSRCCARGRWLSLASRASAAARIRFKIIALG